MSYSRADSGFAQELVSGIEACGFDAFIDKADIAHGEAWQSRLSDLINRADTIVWIVSPASLSSEIVAWELDTAAKASKRIVPVSYSAVDMSQVPEDLRRLNFCFFFNRPFGDALKDLAVALRMDVGWLREHTRVADLARRWDELGRTDDLLLRGKELDAVRQWSSARPANAPPLTDIQAALIASSNRAQEDADRNAKRRGRRVALIASAVAIVMTGLAGASGWLMLQAREANLSLAASLERNKKTLRDLEAANYNLSKPRPLSFAVTGGRKFVLGGEWFGRATYNLRSLIRIEDGPRSDQGLSRMVGTGFAMKGNLLHPDWDHDVIVTMQFVVNAEKFGAAEPYAGTECSVSASDTQTCMSAAFAEPLYLSSSVAGAAIFKVPTELAPHVGPIEEILALSADQLERAYGTMVPQPDADGSQKLRRPAFAFSYGFPNARGAELIFMQLVSFADIDGAGRALWMAHATEPGMSGAPVFAGRDFKLAGIHARRCDLNGNFGSEAFACSVWIGDIIADIQQNYRTLAPADSIARQGELAQ